MKVPFWTWYINRQVHHMVFQCVKIDFQCGKQTEVVNFAGCWIYNYILYVSVDLCFILAQLNIREKKKINLPPWSFMLLVVTVQCYVRVSFVLNLFFIISLPGTNRIPFGRRKIKEQRSIEEGCWGIENDWTLE